MREDSSGRKQEVTMRGPVVILAAVESINMFITEFAGCQIWVQLCVKADRNTYGSLRVNNPKLAPLISILTLTSMFWP